MNWTAALTAHSGGKLIAADGKTIRRSFDHADGKAAITMISAWCQQNHLVLGQLATDAESNEITALPKLLALLDLRDSVVTLDAMHCQKDTARQIIDGGGDYIMQVKSNHPTLREEMKLFFDEAHAADFEHMAYARDVDAGHGRIETRTLYSTWDIDWFAERDDWPGLNSFVCLTCEREIGGKKSVQQRLYLSSLDGRDADALLRAIRGHWGIENRLHWVLDVSFREDDSRIRKDHGAENFSRLRRLALNLLQRETTQKVGKKAKSKLCGWDHDYLLNVLTQPT